MALMMTGNVAIFDMNRKKGEALVEELGGGTRVAFFECNVRRKLLPAVKQTLGYPGSIHNSFSILLKKGIAAAAAVVLRPHPHHSRDPPPPRHLRTVRPRRRDGRHQTWPSTGCNMHVPGRGPCWWSAVPRACVRNRTDCNTVYFACTL